MINCKRIISVILFLLIIFTMFNTQVFAKEIETQLEIVKSKGEVKYLDKDQGYISKAIVDSNSDEGEVTINLKLSNTANSAGEKEEYDSTEIYIVVSENIATDNEKLEKYITYIETLATKIFKKSSNTKIGIVGIKGTVSDGKVDENGNMIWGEKDEGDVKGTADNAEIILKPTKSIKEIKSKLQNMNSNKTKYRENLQAAIRIANNNYSKNARKILVLLYDNVPSISIGVKSQVSYGGYNEYKTVEEAVKGKHEKIATETRTEILSLKNNDVDFILLRPDDTSYDETWYSMTTGEKTLDFDGSPYVKKIYGTLEKPTYGKLYSLNNSTLEKIVTEYIYEDILKDIRVDLESVVIKEYFSEEILENFDIEFLNEEVDTTKLDKSNYAIWDVGEVAENKTVNLKYKLKIKNMKNKKLLDKEIATSEKVELTYIDSEEKEKTVISKSSPKIKLTEIKEELEATVSYDPTTKTTEKVTATIQTNKKVNKVDGWKLSKDGKTLTKIYSKNATETVTLKDEDGMIKDVKVKISNITAKKTNKNEVKNKVDNTLADKRIPDAGRTLLFWIIGIVGVSGIVAHIRYKKLHIK